jgi:hypothetical protein
MLLNDTKINQLKYGFLMCPLVDIKFHHYFVNILLNFSAILMKNCIKKIVLG